MEAAFSSSSSSSSKVPQPFYASLHSVRKPMAKPWKKPIAPLPPTPPKVYRVDPINFRDLVQKLTGAPEFMSPPSDHLQSSSSSQLQQQQQPPLHQRLQRVAPPPLHVAAISPLSRAEVSAPILHLASGLDHTKPDEYQKFSDSLGFNLSPSSNYNWCAFPILSPGTLSNLV